VQYSSYFHRLAELNNSRADNEKMFPTGTHHCFEPRVPEALIGMGVFDEFFENEWVDETTLNSVDELTHEIPELWLDYMAESLEADIPSRVEEALSTICFEYNRMDARGSTLSFFTEIYTKLAEAGCTSAIESSGKWLATKIIPKLEPSNVRQVITKAWRYWSTVDQNDFKTFRKYVLESAVLASKWSDKKRIIDVAGIMNDQESSKSKKRRIAAELRRPRLHEKAGKAKDGQDSSGKSMDKSQVWKHSCLNKECKGNHRIKECTNTSEELKQQLLHEFYANKRKNAGKTSAVVLQSADGTLDHSCANGRWSATIGEITRVVALGDIGADYSCIPRSLVPTIIQDGVRISESKRPSTVSLEGAVKNSHITAKSIFRADLTLQLNCGPLILRQTEFLVLDQEMSEILIGRPLLKAIGFDLEAHLETNRDVLNNSTFGTNLLNTVNTRSFGKAARSSYSDLQCNTADSDPVPPTETAGVATGTDSASEIQDEIERMIGSAKLNGMSSVGLTSARELLQDFREIFRIRLGSDPPAKIPPLNVQLKPHFAPVKETQRRYAPTQRVFLSTTIKKLESLGAVRANPTSLWALPALAVPKAGSEGYRFTVDLLSTNAQTEPMASSMPHMESMFQSVQGSRCFAKVDLCHSYWQLALAVESQEIFSIQTPGGIYTPTRLIQGTPDAGN
jgi:hypothetical protein